MRHTAVVDQMTGRRATVVAAVIAVVAFAVVASFADRKAIVIVGTSTRHMRLDHKTALCEDQTIWKQDLGWVDYCRSHQKSGCCPCSRLRICRICDLEKTCL